MMQGFGAMEIIVRINGLEPSSEWAEDTLRTRRF
jgi:hypothetical protein